jgi:hypothetical protein
MGSMMRSRWAAIGAAVAVTLGAGGMIGVSAASPPSTFVAIAPTRVLDTRFDIGLTDAFTHRTPRLLDVTGTIPIVLPGNTQGTAVVVPDGATAIVANVTAVNPTTAGFVAVRPGDATGDPTTSNLNFSTGGVVVPNSVTVEIPTSGADAGKLNLYFSGTNPSATTHLLVDIVGYYSASGATGFTYLTASETLTVDTWGDVVTPLCPAGQLAISGGLDPGLDFDVDDPGPEAITYFGHPNSATQFRNWVIGYNNSSLVGEDYTATLYTVCATVGG